jgi:protein-tyrosine phosphatase
MLTSDTEIHARFIDLEWQQRNRLLAGAQHPAGAQDPSSQWARLTGDKITERNRYLNVEPFAGNRIKLNTGEGLSDYINASPIQLGRRRYIATQGPKHSTISHFYRMLVDEVRDPAVIVMLTQTHESGREKCFQYYPLSADQSLLRIPLDNDSDDGFHGEVELLDTQYDQSTRTDIRRLRLRTNTAIDTQQEHRDQTDWEEKEIYHLLYGGWPDFLVPEGEDRETLLHLIQLSNDLKAFSSSHSSTKSANETYVAESTNSTQDNPLIVHCSAGVGRTGAFIALDYLLSLLHAGQLDTVADETDPIQDTVDAMRQQRMMMVQGEGQYHFLYEILKEAFLERASGQVRGIVHAGEG